MSSKSASTQRSKASFPAARSNVLHHVQRQDPSAGVQIPYTPLEMATVARNMECSNSILLDIILEVLTSEGRDGNTSNALDLYARNKPRGAARVRAMKAKIVRTFPFRTREKKEKFHPFFSSFQEGHS